MEHIQKTIFGDFVNHGLWHWRVRTVVANVDIETIHDVVVRVSKQFFHSRIFNGDVDTFSHKTTEIGSWRECAHVF